MSGRITAIIPVKSLASAKTRMATHLSPTDRIELARYLLLHVLDVVGRSKAVERYLVVSPDSAVLALARSVGALPVLERDYVATRGQNAALEQAREVIRAWSTEAILVLAGDLPLLSVQDLQGIAELGSSERI
ncbi:MAG TPA: NTP transferase domain-containing protein, partial [Chloroflexota bacterium]|nr:NTP transferase domain-containing protein [Chloroflexota bacterium]